ncbi:MAG TPA: hypothetical protein VLK32_06470 [Bacillota bacterium]|nr:hypothetical protein [Bacillota bacterium]
MERGKDYHEGPYDLLVWANIVDRYDFLVAWRAFRREYPAAAEAVLRRWVRRVADIAPHDYDFQVNMTFVKDYQDDPTGNWIPTDSLKIEKSEGGGYRVLWAMGFAERVGGVVECHLRARWVR